MFRLITTVILVAYSHLFAVGGDYHI